MQCRQCGTVNPEGANFCLNCGARRATACPRCGTELPAEAKFCFNCAAPVHATDIHAPSSDDLEVSDTAAARALKRLAPQEYAERLLAAGGQVSRERRMVTILFADIKGSTVLAEDLDPEDVMEIMDGAFDVLIEPVYRYEGTVARLMGDAVLAFFGAPIAHEDDPERACRAALDIIAGAQAYAARLERERGVQGFDVRVGINTGLVVVGEVGSDLRVEYTAMGDAVNLAARLEAAAETGMVLVSEATQRLIAPLFEMEALGAMEVKGRRQPVAVYRMLSARAEADKVRGIAGLESPLVGRGEELRGLAEVLEGLASGTGGIVTVVGEAGIGKSRLITELRKESQRHAKVRKPSYGWVQWVEGRCLSYGSSMAYLLWLEVLRDLLGVRPEDAPEAVLDAQRGVIARLCPDQYDEVYPFVAQLMSVPLEKEMEARLGELDGRKLKAGTFQAVQTLIGSAASQKPLVLVAEDLHWADPTSLELLEEVLVLTADHPLLVVCVFRPDREHRSWRLREIAAQEHYRRHTDLWLNPLSQAESARLVGNLLWLDQLPPALKERILKRAEGNPFYLEEVLRSLIDEGAIEQEARTGHWRATREVSEITIPDTLQGVLTARIDRLQEKTKKVLKMASVIGRIFLYRVLAAIAQEERDLDARLLALQEEEMIREHVRLPDLEYIFKHELTRQAAYSGLLKKERSVFHHQAAEALERLFPKRREELVGLLAHHWERAGDSEKATEYLLRAGDQARLCWAHNEAIDYYQRALTLLNDQATGSDAPEREQDKLARTLMKLGLTHHSAFDFQQARRAFDEGFALWQRAGGNAPAVSLPPAPHALRLEWGDPATLDPGLADDEGSIAITRQLFSGLVEMTAETDIVPGVASSWELTHGGRRAVFHLRDDVFWSDGLPVTAHDFEYAWKRVLDPATSSGNASMLYDLKGASAFHQGRVSVPDGVGVQALNDVTLLLEFEAPVGYLLHLLTYPAAYPVPRHALRKYAEDWTAPEKIVTNGPFTLKSWHRGDSLVLDRYPQYHGRRTGNVQQVGLSSFPVGEWLPSLKSYRAGSLDLFHLQRDVPEEMDRLRQLHAGEYVWQPLSITSFLAFPVTRSPFDDPRVRRALTFATDREALAQVTTGGYRLPATGGFVPPGMPGHSPDIALPYDPERARQLLAAAGYPNGEGFPQIDLVDGIGLHDQAQYLHAQWRENLGVDMQCTTLDWGDYVATFPGAPPNLFFHAWQADYPDPDSFMRVGLSGVTAWNHRTYFDFVETARRSVDQAERMRLYLQAEQILLQEAPIVPLLYGRLHMLLKPWVRSYPISATGIVLWKDVVLEPH